MTGKKNMVAELHDVEEESKKTQAKSNRTVGEDRWAVSTW
jgi:hypothetical protein